MLVGAGSIVGLVLGAATQLQDPGSTRWELREADVLSAGQSALRSGTLRSQERTQGKRRSE